MFHSPGVPLNWFPVNVGFSTQGWYPRGLESTRDLRDGKFQPLDRRVFDENGMTKGFLVCFGVFNFHELGRSCSLITD